ncbi:MAG TPA: hypothetical protein VMN37_02495 [Gemmatimonadales bacterium]|nr:hypothetical protein [Gemmatimonadales bacterium]
MNAQTTAPRAPLKVLGPRYSGIVRRLFCAIAADAPAGELVAEEAETARALGESLAGVLRAQAAEEWTAETGRCAWCGGPEHAP